LKILYIADSTSIHTKRWISYFRDAGHEISIITLGKKQETIPGIRHLANYGSFYYGSPYFLLVLFKARQIVIKENPDIVHGHFVHQYGWLAALIGKHPLVITAWGTDILNLPESSRIKIGKLLTQYALKKADLTTGTSEHLKAEMIRLKASPDRAHVIFWGVDVNNFKPDVDNTALRRKLGIDFDQTIILSNRNQSELYNNDIVIKAMPHILKNFPKAILILQNSGGNLEPQLKSLVQKMGITKSVLFLPQFSHEELPALYSLADIYISVPSWDAGPVSLKEAMACGAVPIISDLPGPREWICNEVNGKIVPVRDVEKLRDAVNDLMRHKEKLKLFAEYNVNLIRDKADHVVQMQKMESLYKMMITINHRHVDLP
jgi:glycosyltransferase involved in cell wall biosynthesis